MRRPHYPAREETGAVGWVALADAMILALVVVLMVSLLATGALQASRRENDRLRQAVGADPDEFRRTADERDALRAERDTLAGRLAVAERVGRDLVAQLAAADRRERDLAARLALAERANRELATKAKLWKEEQEQRFEGTPLVGESVVFLVDVSGSMIKADFNTPAPDKWPAVCDTVAKLMKSLPKLARYQVVLFSRSARWLTGTADWQEFKGQESVEAVRTGLKAIQPADGTNMHAGFELAFQLLPKKLDTIYLFSDGLPNEGPGLTAAQQAAVPPLEETARAEILGRHVRERLRTTWNKAAAGPPPVRINAVGFYFESPDLGAFLWAISRENNGNFVGLCRP